MTSKDHRKLVSTSLVRADQCDQDGPTIRIWGRNSGGGEVVFTILLEWWLWPMLVKAIAKLWLQERLRRTSEIDVQDATFRKAKARAARTRHVQMELIDEETASASFPGTGRPSRASTRTDTAGRTIKETAQAAEG